MIPEIDQLTYLLEKYGGTLSDWLQYPYQARELFVQFGRAHDNARIVKARKQ